MKIYKLDEIKEFTNILKKDKNGRVINLYNLGECQFNTDKTFYPDVSIYSYKNKKHFNPINEIVLSLEKQSIKKNTNLTVKKYKYDELNPVFYFIYNTENYFHFIYDTLPYLITFKKLKDTTPDIKLLVNYPNQQTKHIYKFVLEFLSLVGINLEDLIFVNDETVYKNIFISSSYTHDENSNLPPREEVYGFFRFIVNSNLSHFKNGTPKKIYISRRSWIHNDYSNIGTNYTAKRKMCNEDELVNLLEKMGYVEIFTENLNTIEKLNLFFNAESVIGAIGGGLCNVLFSKKDTKLLTIVSPTFLDVNHRFKYSLDGVSNNYFYNTTHTEDSEFNSNMRVECEELSIVGEVSKIDGDMLSIIYSDNLVSGWNNQINFKKTTVNSKSCKKLDEGLNSPFLIDLEKIKSLIF